MPQVPSTETVRILMASVGMTADHNLEFVGIMFEAWQAFPSEVPLWRSRGSLCAKLGVLHLLVYASLAWASDTRH